MNNIVNYSPEAQLVVEGARSGIEALRSICDTYKDVKSIEAMAATERMAIRKQAEVAIYQYKEETKRILNKNEKIHEERMAVINIIKELADKGIVDSNVDNISGLIKDILTTQKEVYD